MARRQLRLALTVSEEEQLEIRRAYAAHLETVNKPVSMNKWLKEMIFDKVRQ